MLRKFSIAFAIIAMAAVAGACSPKSETDQAIDDFDKAVDKMIDFSKGKTPEQMQAAQDTPEWKEIDKEGQAAGERLEKLQGKFTPEQKTRVEAIQKKATDAMTKSAP